MLIQSINSNINKYKPQYKTNASKTSFTASREIKAAKNNLQQYIPDLYPKTFKGFIENHLFKKDLILKEMENQKALLANYGISYVEENFFSALKDLFKKGEKGFDDYMQMLQHMVTDIPNKIKSTFDLASFIFTRMFTAYQGGKYNQESYDLFNEIFSQKEDINIDHSKIRIIINNLKDNEEKIDSDKKDFVLKNINSMDIDNLKTLVQIIRQHQLDIEQVEKLMSFKNLEYSETLWDLDISLDDYGEEVSPVESVVSNKKLYSFNRFYDLNPEEKNYEKAKNLALTNPDKEDVDFICKNYNYENIVDLVKVINNLEVPISENCFDMYEYFINQGFTREEIDNTFFMCFGNDKLEDSKEYLDKIAEYIKKYPDVSKGNIANVVGHLRFCDKKNFDKNINKIFELRDFCNQNKMELSSDGSDVSQQAIDDFILGSAGWVIEALKLINEKTFKFALLKGLSFYTTLIMHLYDYDPDTKEANNRFFDPPQEDLLEVINPQNSGYYKFLEKQIKDLKSEYQKIVDSDQKHEIQNKINTLTHEKNELIKNSIKDPQQIIETVNIYKTLFNIGKHEEFIPYLNPKTNEESKLRQEKLNNLIFEIINPDREYNPQTLERFDFANSKYLSKLFESNDRFKKTFIELLDAIDEPDKSVKELLNSLPHNINNNRVLKANGIDYKKWDSPLNELKEEVEVKIDIDKAKINAVKNLEKDLNDSFFKSLPKNKQENLINALKMNGYVLQKDPATYFNKIYKNNQHIEFDDIKKVLEVLKNEMNKDDFWTLESMDETADNIKFLLQDHLFNLRYNEYKRLSNKHFKTEAKLTIQKVDMNDIAHSLFLGNDSCCCTAVDGCNAFTAPKYILTKAIQAIEIKDGENSIGNTMCFWGKINNKPALILDNIEIKPMYQYSEQLRDGIVEFAKKMAKEIAGENAEVYAGPNRHKVDFPESSKKMCVMDLIGDYGDGNIYFDIINTEDTLFNYEDENRMDIRLYKLT